MTNRWDLCAMCGPMVRCGNCGNNCCNGGSGDGCADECASAYALQKQNRPPVAVLEAWDRWQQGGVLWEQVVSFRGGAA